MKLKITLILTICAATLLFSCKHAPTDKDRLGKATREDKNGWIYIHLAGSPSDIGFQHG